MMRAPVSSTDPLARARGTFDDDVGLLRRVGVDGLLEELRAPGPGHRLAVARPLQVVAAFGRHALDRDDGVVAAAGDADVDGFAPGHRHGDQEVSALEADERARAVGRQANLGRAWRVVAGPGAGHAEVRAAVVAVERDRLQAAAAAEIDAPRIVAREVRIAPALRRGDEGRRASGRGNRSQLQRVGRADAADLDGAPSSSGGGVSSRIE